MRQLSRRNRAVSSLLVAALLALVSACGGSNNSAAVNATEAPVHKGAANTLNWWANYGDAWPDSLDPAVGTSALAIDAEYLVDANLVKLSYPSLKAIGDLAQSWTVTHGGTVYTFTLRPHARFNNGDSVTASDAAWSLTRALLPGTKSPTALTYLGHIAGASAVTTGKSKRLSGVKVLGRRTLQITLDAPVAYFLTALSNTTGDVLEKKILAGKPANTFLTNDCSANAGAGPFKFVCRNTTSSRASFYPSGASPSMDLVPNPYYYGPKPRIKIHAPIYATAEDLFRAYQAGEVDGATVPSSDISVAKAMKGFVNVPQFETDYITPNSQIPPFNNLHCRLAVAYAIDREGITHTILRNTYTPLYDVLPPGITGYAGRLPGFPYYDPARAKQELAQCPGRLKDVTMTIQNTSVDIQHEYDAIRTDLKRIGADITLRPLDFNAWLKVVTQNMTTTKSQETITENLWIDDYPDPEDWMSNLLRSGANDDVGGFSNRQFDRLVDSAAVEPNRSKRAALYVRAQKIALSGGFWIAVGAVNGLYVMSPRVHGMIASNGWTWPVNNDWSNVYISKN